MFCCAEDCKIESFNCEPEDDAAFLSKVNELHASAGTKAGKGASSKAKAQAKLQPNKLQLAENNVAKVVKDGVTHLEFLPAASACVLAVADKKGYVRCLLLTCTACESVLLVGHRLRVLDHGDHACLCAC